MLANVPKFKDEGGVGGDAFDSIWSRSLPLFLCRDTLILQGPAPIAIPRERQDPDISFFFISFIQKTAKNVKNPLMTRKCKIIYYFTSYNFDKASCTLSSVHCTVSHRPTHHVLYRNIFHTF